MFCGTAAANGPIVHPPDDERVCSSAEMTMTGEK
jgi:hypothetical protein